MQEIVCRFETEGRPVRCVRYGSGHINETWLVETDCGHPYILQKVNSLVFPDWQGLMNNIILVTEHLRRKDPDPRHVLTLVPTKDGAMYIHRESGELWRMYEQIRGGVCLEQAGTPDDFRQSGIAFGTFQRQLADFPAERLAEVIPGFHDTPKRYAALRAAVTADPRGRAASVRRETDFYLQRETSVSRLQEMRERGELPLRVTHNDTKLNNVILDAETRTPLCVLDLDTVMPGLVATDFGEAVRFGASTAAEDEKDLDRVHFSPELYRAFARGFLSVCGESLTPAELETLPDGARTMTIENGVRFLTDYLMGDVYFHIDRPEHNLDRSRTQMRLAEEMERQEGLMRRIAAEAAAEKGESSD